MATPVNIPISSVVSVTITKDTGSVELANFDTLLLVGVAGATPVIPNSEVVRTYNSIEGVVADFALTSEVYKAADIYFSQSKRPDQLIVTLRYGTAGEAPEAGSKILGQAATFDIGEWNAVTNGSFSFIYNDTVLTLSNLDFSSVTSPLGVAAIIQGQFNNLSLSNPNVGFAPVGDQVSTTWYATPPSANPWEDLTGQFWVLKVAPTGELFFNYDVSDGNFYIGTTSLSKEFVKLEAAANGTDISGSTFLNMAEGRTIGSVVFSKFASDHSALAITDLTGISTVSNGGFSADVDGVTTQFEDIDFTEINEVLEIPDILSKKMSLVLGFEVNVGLTSTGLVIQGANKSIKVDAIASPSSGTDMSAILFGTMTTVAPYTYVQTPPQAIQAAFEKSTDWYGVALTKESATVEVSNTNILRTASFVQAMSKMYFARLSQLDVASSSTSDIGSLLANNNFTRTVPMFTALDQYVDTGAAAKLLTTIPGSSILAFKSIEGVTASALTAGTQDLVLKKNVNIISVIGGVPIIREGTVSSIQKEFADTTRFIDFLINEIEVNIFSLIIGALKVPYTDPGVSILKTGVKLALDIGVENGGLAARYDPATKKLNPAYEIFAKRVADAPLSQRANRISPNITFTATLADAIQQVTVVGVVSV